MPLQYISTGTGHMGSHCFRASSLTTVTSLAPTIKISKIRSIAQACAATDKKELVGGEGLSGGALHGVSSHCYSMLHVYID